ncbi:S41 family peptidase [Hymenobacter sp. GOD-10R]|uniref:S41 family peptidase n=1 Tax=Hymenobacter sp. GOD-10R TaxID=3093922 RepID=UPI002D774A23|nr:S41 family peptidase [Hymenobacter sp. GOD-10R]WRQ31856.1 S41 family peptidase [Hymenobacter sp. GOD-10R]
MLTRSRLWTLLPLTGLLLLLGSRVGQATPSASPPAALTQRLATFAQVWGFLKYHHPGMARPHLDWDSVLVRQLPQVQAARTPAAFHVQVARLLSVLGPPPTTARAVPPELLPRNVDVGWLTHDPLLSPALRQQLMQLWQQHAFPAVHPTVTETAAGLLEHHERAYPDMVLPAEAYRLLTLFRYWNIIQYYYPYKYAIGTPWPSVLRTFIPRFQQATTAPAYHLLVLELVAQLHDTHAFLYGSTVLSAQLGDYYPPLELTQLEGQVVVAQVYRDATPAVLPVQVGDVVLQANGVAVQQILTRYQPYVAASTPAALQRDLLRFVLRGQAQDSLALTVRTRTGVRTVRLARSLSILSLRSASYKTYFFGMNPRDTTHLWRRFGYLHLGGLQETQLPSVLPQLARTRGLILDLRAYPSASVGSLLAALPPAAAPVRRLGLRADSVAAIGWARSTVPTLTYPGYTRWTPLATLAPSTRRPASYPGQVVVLVNEKTQSYGETLAMLLQARPGVVIVGSQTAGANGNIVPVPLPGGLETYYSGVGMYYPDGGETQRRGIVPNLVVTPTVAGLQAGRDEVLDRAVAYLQQP